MPGKSLSVLTLIVSCLFLTNCAKNDPVEPLLGTDEPGPIWAKIDGAAFESSGPLSLDVDMHIDTDFDQFDLQIDGEGEKGGIEQRITISLFGEDFAGVEAGAVFFGGADITKGEYRFDGDFYRISRVEGSEMDIIADSEQTASSICTITKIDHDNNLISGTFKFKAIDISDPTSTFEITEGKFEDIAF